jgi:hypothetical protein
MPTNSSSLDLIKNKYILQLRGGAETLELILLAIILIISCLSNDSDGLTINLIVDHCKNWVRGYSRQEIDRPE